LRWRAREPAALVVEVPRGIPFPKRRHHEQPVDAVRENAVPDEQREPVALGLADALAGDETVRDNVVGYEPAAGPASSVPDSRAESCVGLTNKGVFVRTRSAE
jgi:hypothetical protein